MPCTRLAHVACCRELVGFQASIDGVPSHLVPTRMVQRAARAQFPGSRRVSRCVFIVAWARRAHQARRHQRQARVRLARHDLRRFDSGRIRATPSDPRRCATRPAFADVERPLDVSRRLSEPRRNVKRRSLPLTAAKVTAYTHVYRDCYSKVCNKSLGVCGFASRCRCLVAHTARAFSGARLCSRMLNHWGT